MHKLQNAFGNNFTKMYGKVTQMTHLPIATPLPKRLLYCFEKRPLKVRRASAVFATSLITLKWQMNVYACVMRIINPQGNYASIVLLSLCAID